MKTKLVEITSLDGIAQAAFVMFAVICVILLAIRWIWKESTKLP